MATNNSWNNAIAAANSAITLNSGTNAISISSDASATTVNVGTGAAAKTVTVGSTTTTSSLALKYGTSDFTLASATGTVISALDTGEITTSLQPSFFAAVTSTFTNVTGTGSFYQYVAATEIWDTNSDYNTGTGVFTAPVTGKYVICVNGALVGCTINTQISMKITTSNRDFQYNYIRPASSANNQLSFTPICDMDAGDTATFYILGAGEAGNTDDVYGDGSSAGTSCSGWLLG